MDPQEALNQALTAYNKNDFKTAEILAGQLAELFPNDVNLLKLKGVSQLHQKNFSDSISSFSRAVLLQPESVEFWSLLGKTRTRLNDYSGAIDAFSHVIALDPDNMEAHSLYLLQIIKAVGFNPQAVRQAFDRWRGDFFGGAPLEQITGVLEERIPYKGEIRPLFRNLSNIAHIVQETELAVGLFSISCVKIEDCKGSAKTSDDLKEAYTGLAGGYDGLDLHQRIPKELVDFVTRHVQCATDLRVIDGACGTGLVGVLLRPMSRRLIGIDLSQEMLDHAKRKGVYDGLVSGDLIEGMAGLEPSFDLITSCAALYHFGDLSGVFEQSSRLLGPGGLLAFSVDPCGDDWEILQTSPSEYAHSRRYLRRLAEDSGLAEVAIEILPHRAYPGFFCAFRKS